MQIRLSFLLALVSSAACVFAQQPPKGVTEPHLGAGLRNPDGSARPVPPPHKTTKRILDVTRFGADPIDSAHDDRLSIEAALNEAKAGDEVYFPNGVYNLNSNSTKNPGANILLKSGVNLRGESEAGVKLISNYDGGPGKFNFAILRGVDANDITVSRMTLTSTWNRKFSTNPREMNPDRGGPLYGIAIDGNAGKNERLTFEHLTVERFARMGIRLGKGTFDSVIRYCTALNATDIAGGGSGYGFVIQGQTHQDNDVNPFLGTNNDTAYNVIEHSKAIGPYMRHGALIQFWAHNNAIRHNVFSRIVYDAIDLHGEDEYLNEIHDNVVTEVTQGAGIGIGNSGAGHDKSGPWNWIHHNTVTNAKVGLTAEYGTVANVIEDNVFQKSENYDEAYGMSLGSIKNFIIRRNSIINNSSKGFIGIRLVRNRAEGSEPSGVVSNTRFENNIITGNKGAGARAVVIVEQGNGNVWTGNIIKDNADNTAP